MTSIFDSKLGSTYDLQNQEDDPLFEQKVANGEFIEVEPGVFQSVEAATWPLAALADAHAKGRDKPPSNTSGAFIIGGGDGKKEVNRFCNFFSRRRRDD